MDISPLVRIDFGLFALEKLSDLDVDCSLVKAIVRGRKRLYEVEGASFDIKGVA